MKPSLENFEHYFTSKWDKDQKKKKTKQKKNYIHMGNRKLVHTDALRQDCRILLKKIQIKFWLEIYFLWLSILFARQIWKQPANSTNIKVVQLID